MRATVRFVGFIVAILVFWANSAVADEVGAVGTVVGLEINDDSADTYLTHHGRMFVMNADKTLTEYRWGGSACGTRVLSDTEVASLHRALDGKQMRIQPRYQLGQADIFCVVGFTLAPKKAVSLVLP